MEKPSSKPFNPKLPWLKLPGTTTMVVVIAVLSVVASQIDPLSLLLKPLRIFDSFLHEMSHALVCLLTGGNVQWIKLAGGGVTDCRGGNETLIALSGYIGQAILGSALIFFAARKNSANTLLLCIGVCIGLANLFFLRDRYTITWGVLVGATMAYAGMKASPKWAHFLVLLLAVQTTLNVFGDVEFVLEHSLGLAPNIHESDATHLARLTGVPAIYWSVLWCAFSVAILSASLYITTRKPKLWRQAVPVAGEQSRELDVG